MKAATLILKNVLQVKKDLDAIEKKRVKAAETLTKIEGFRLFEKLKEEVRKARPGGTRLTPLSQIARRTKTGKRKKNARKPLASLAHLVRYKATREAGQFNAAVGFISPKMDTRSWKKLVTLHQEGGASTLSGGSRSALGRRLARIGGKLKKSGDPDAKFFFLTTDARRGMGAFSGMMIPARSVVDPFWRANKSEAQRNITKSWERKMAGERI